MKMNMPSENWFGKRCRRSDGQAMIRTGPFMGSFVPKLQSLFIYSAGILLLATALAKLISVFGRSEILDVEDPLFGFSYRYVMLIVGFLELSVSLLCLLAPKTRLSLNLVIWLATTFLVYRFGNIIIGYKHLCPCLGYFYDAIHLSPRIADLLAEMILAYLLTGGYGLLVMQSLRALSQSKNDMDPGGRIC
jgi:hypothetical protein